MKNKGAPAAKDGLMHKIEQSLNKAKPKIAKTEILAYELTQRIRAIGVKVPPGTQTILLVSAESAASLAKEKCQLFKVGNKIYFLEKIITEKVDDRIRSILANWERDRLAQEFWASNPRASMYDLQQHLYPNLVHADGDGPVDKQLSWVPWENNSILICTKPADWVETRSSRNYAFHHAETDGAYYAQVTCEQEENGCFFPIKVYSRAKNEDVSSQLVDTGKESTLERAKIEAENMMLCLKALDQKKAKKPARKRSTA